MVSSSSLAIRIHLRMGSNVLLRVNSRVKDRHILRGSSGTLPGDTPGPSFSPGPGALGQRKGCVGMSQERQVHPSDFWE